MDNEREERQKKIEINSKAMQIRAALENIKNIPGVPDDIKEKVQGMMKDMLPFIKDELEAGIAKFSEKLGTKKNKKIYVIRNGADGPELWIMENMRAFDGDVIKKFSSKTIVDRIHKYGKPEALIADTLVGKLFGMEDYFIDTEPHPTLAVATPPASVTSPVPVLTATVTEHPALPSPTDEGKTKE